VEVIKSERTVFFDIDGTLVHKSDPKNDAPTILIHDPYSDRMVHRQKHLPHIKLLTNYIARDFTVFVWSKNGYRWAAEVLEALRLSHLPIRVLTKPCVFVDDEPPANWLGEQVFIPSTSSFGRD
jgi:FMN phosphatase YigB (HAD superfamily)